MVPSPSPKEESRWQVGREVGVGVGIKWDTPPIFCILSRQLWSWKDGFCLPLGCRDSLTLCQIQAVHIA